VLKILSHLVEKALETKTWDSLARNVVAKIDVRFGEPRIKPDEIYSIKQKLDPECVYAFACAELDRPSYYLEHWLFKAIFSHAGLVLPNLNQLILRPDDFPQEPHAVHIDTLGLHTELFVNVLAVSDKYCLVKLPIKADKIPEFYTRLNALILRNPQYDTAFDLLNHAKEFCSEVVYDMCEGLIDDTDFQITWSNGKATFIPDVIPTLGEIISQK
jgi:hypothetical protein